MNQEILLKLINEKHLDPSQVLYLQQVSRQFNDDLSGYLLKQDISSPESFQSSVDKAVLVSSYLHELQRRGNEEKVEEVRTMLMENSPLEDIVTHTALILSHSLTSKQYAKAVKQGEKAIQTEIRKKQRSIIESRMKPFKAISTLQYYIRIAALAGLISFTAGLAHWLNYQEDHNFIGYAKQHQLVRKFESVEKEMVGSSLEARFSQSDIFVPQPFDNNLEWELATIDSLPIYLGDTNTPVLNPYLLKQKIEKYRSFIEKNRGTEEAVKARYDLASLLRDGQAVFGRSSDWFVEEMSAFDEAIAIPNFANTEYILRAYQSIYEYTLEQVGKRDTALKLALNWLESQTQRKESNIPAAYHALAKLYSEGYNENDHRKINPEKDEDKIRKAYEGIVKHTQKSDECGRALLNLYLQNGSFEINPEKPPLDLLERMDKYKFIAHYTGELLVRYNVLLQIGKGYLALKDYERANAYFEYILQNIDGGSEKSQLEPLKRVRKQAEDLQVNENWRTFLDKIF